MFFILTFLSLLGSFMLQAMPADETIKSNPKSSVASSDYSSQESPTPSSGLKSEENTDTNKEESTTNHILSAKVASRSLDFSGKTIVSFKLEQDEKDSNVISSSELIEILNQNLRVKLVPRKAQSQEEFQSFLTRNTELQESLTIDFKRILEILGSPEPINKKNAWQEFQSRLKGNHLTPPLASPLYKWLNLQRTVIECDEKNPIKVLNFSNCQLGKDEGILPLIVTCSLPFKHIHTIRLENNHLSLESFEYFIKLARREWVRFISLYGNDFTADEAMLYAHSYLDDHDLEIGLSRRLLLNKFILYSKEEFEEEKPDSDFWVESWNDSHQQFYKEVQ